MSISVFVSVGGFVEGDFKYEKMVIVSSIGAVIGLKLIIHGVDNFFVDTVCTTFLLGIGLIDLLVAVMVVAELVNNVPHGTGGGR